MPKIKQINNIEPVWIFDNKILEDADIPENAIAFLYIITHLETGRWYIGRKNIFKNKYKTVKGKKKKYKAPSDWKTYWSSSDFLKSMIAKEGSEKFSRTILLFVETASATIYSEEALLYISGGLFNPDCINGHIRTKIMRSWFATKESNLHQRILDISASLPIFKPTT